MHFLKTTLAVIVGVLVSMALVFVIWMSVVAGAMASFSKTVTVDDNSILRIDLSETIVDAPSANPLANIDMNTLQPRPEVSLYKALQAITVAANDDRIKGIYLRLNGAGGVDGTAVLEELRSALEEFKKSGKFVVAYNEYYFQGTYYLASVADKIYLQPEGIFEWRGLAANLMFYKGLIDKLDLNVEIFRPTVCKYKSAVEPYFLKQMSDENRRQMQAVVDSSWKTISEAVSSSRGISVERLNEMADRLTVALPEDALREQLVDGLIYEDEMDDIFTKLGAEADSRGKHHFVSLGEYASQLVPSGSFSSPQVAIVYADGEIVDGEGNDQKIYGNTLAKTLRKVRLDENIKSVVLRVNSPGGSALAADIIWREVELLKAVKPVIVSMGSYAASGGYYISAPSDLILANRTTLTGSIGVFGMIPNVGKALNNKLGVTLDGVKTNSEADGVNILTPISEAQRKSIMRGVDKVYATFTGKVADGRNLPIEKVLDIAGGRVWTGADALSIGLADGNGGMMEAIGMAVEKADLQNDFRVVEMVEQPTGLAALLLAFNSAVRAEVKGAALPDAVQTLTREIDDVRDFLGRSGVMMYCPYKIDIE